MNTLLERMHGEWSPCIDIMFIRLHEELVQWPDDWHVDQHGSGNNPHVYFNKRCPCGAYDSGLHELKIGVRSKKAAAHNTRVLNRAIAEAPKGATVVLPAGEINLRGPIVMRDVDALTFDGNKQSATLVQHMRNAPAIEVHGCQNLHVRNIRIIGYRRRRMDVREMRARRRAKRKAKRGY